MNITQENIDDLNAVLKIQLSQEDYKAKYDSALKNARKQVDMPGFRSGQVPMNLIKKKYGPSILADEINSLIQSSIGQYISENKLRILGNPLPAESDESNGDWNNPADFNFVFNLGLAPEVDVKLSNKQEFEYFKVKVDEKLVDRQMSDLAKRYGKMSEPEVAEANDLLVGTLIELENNEIKPGGIMNDTTISLEHLEDEESLKVLTGAKIEDEIHVNLKKLATSDADLSKLLGMTVSEAKTITSDFKLRVKEVKRIEPAEYNEELFDKLYGAGNVKTEEEFKQRTKEDLEKMFEKDTEKVFRRKMIEKLLEDTKIPLPDAFLKRWLMETSDKDFSEEQLENDYPHYVKSLSWQLIENNIAAQFKIQVTSDDAKARAKELMAAQYEQYGIDFTEEQLEAFAKETLSKEEDSKYIYDSLVEEKIAGAVKENVKLIEKELAYEDFLEWAQS